MRTDFILITQYISDRGGQVDYLNPRPQQRFPFFILTALFRIEMD